MVVVPATLSESCGRMEQTLSKLQPKFGLSLNCETFSNFVSRNHPDSVTVAQPILSKATKGKKSCQICNSQLKGSGSWLLFHTFDWEEITYSPSSVKLVCAGCEELCSWSKLMSTYLNQTLVGSSAADITPVIERFLKVNGHKVSDISLFNAAVSVFASLRATAAEVKPSIQLPAEDLGALVTRLVSQE